LLVRAASGQEPEPWTSEKASRRCVGDTDTRNLMLAYYENLAAGGAISGCTDLVAVK
jgi:hypothetical protein